MGYKKWNQNVNFVDIGLSLPFDHISPDHSTFSRFRSRLSKEAVTWINNEVLQQFSRQGLTINEGIAIDAQLIQSASHPLSAEELKENKEKKEIAEGQLDKNGKPLKFSLDLELDWMSKEGDPPFYRLKEHASLRPVSPPDGTREDINNGLVLATGLTPASHHDSPYLPLCAVTSRCDHTEKPIQVIDADKEYFGEPNRNFLRLNHLEGGLL